MKKSMLFLTLLGTLPLMNTAAQSGVVAELSFSFTRQSGPASNQFAVWIEDSQGRYVKTLYATQYTAGGGWKIRANSIPLWVKQASLAAMPKDQVDAVSSATPRTGEVRCSWDGTDSRGVKVPPGDYTIYLEATLRWENRAVYSAPLRLGSGPGSREVKAQYYGDPGAERQMIGQVTARILG